jgi:hypothetical protein
MIYCRNICMMGLNPLPLDPDFFGQIRIIKRPLAVCSQLDSEL